MRGRARFGGAYLRAFARGAFARGAFARGAFARGAWRVGRAGVVRCVAKSMYLGGGQSGGGGQVCW